MKKYFSLFCSIACLGGCADFKLNICENVCENKSVNDSVNKGEGSKLIEPIVVFPSLGSNYLLSCLVDMHLLERQDFDPKFGISASTLEHGSELDKLRFICLSLNEKADYKQFKHGTKVLDQYIADHIESDAEMQGIRLLISRLDEEITNRWSAWKSLLNNKKELKAKNESLKVTIEEQQKQIEQLKNIENIIKSRETSKP
jgi:hypothetical protein